MQKRTNETVNIGSIMATDIFGVRHPAVTDANGQPTARQRRANDKPYREQRTVFTDLTDKAGYLRVIAPYITEECVSITMSNYRKYITMYNDMVMDANSEVSKYNSQVKKFRKENPLDETSRPFFNLFTEKHFDKKPKIYNQLVEEFNNDRGMMVEKKRFVKVKYQTELVFRQMLHLYSLQLAKYSPYYLTLGISELKPIRQFELNPHHITNLRRDEVVALDVCNATIRNHRERLEECGVLFGYNFRGHTIGVNYHINDKILVVYDAKTGFMVGTENQSLTVETCKEFVLNNEATGAVFNNNIKKRENAGGAFPINGTPAAIPSIVFYRNIPTQDEKSMDAPGGENVKVLTISEKLCGLITHPHQLAQELAAGLHNTYTPIDIRYLRDEAKSGTMTREEFRALIINDFFKTSSRMWRESTPYIGSWKIAINSWFEKRFTVNNGNGTFILHKDHMCDLLQEFRWRFANAEKWFRKTGIKPLYPNDYFDFTRQDKKEIGFEYTRKHYLKHLNYEETKPQKEKRIKKKAATRAVAVNHSKKYENEINRFFRQRISFEQLHDYVNNNLPPHYLQKLSETILNLSTAKVKYSIHELSN